MTTMRLYRCEVIGFALNQPPVFAWLTLGQALGYADAVDVDVYTDLSESGGPLQPWVAPLECLRVIAEI